MVQRCLFVKPFWGNLLNETPGRCFVIRAMPKLGREKGEKKKIIDPLLVEWAEKKGEKKRRKMIDPLLVEWAGKKGEKKRRTIIDPLLLEWHSRETGCHGRQRNLQLPRDIGH